MNSMQIKHLAIIYVHIFLNKKCIDEASYPYLALTAYMIAMKVAYFLSSYSLMRAFYFL